MNGLGRKALGGAALALLLGTAIGAASASAETVLRIRPFGDLKGIDPITNSDYMARNHGHLIYDTLFAMDEKLQIKPQMVESYETSGDGLVWTFKIRSGMKWHDGAPVRAADCVASLKRWGERDGLGQQLMARTDKLEVVDEHTFKLTLKQPWGLVLDALGKPSSIVPFMMPERIASTPSTQNITDPTGSGPFKMLKDQWMPGNKVVYAKFDDYKPRSDAASGMAGAKLAKVDRVEFVYLPDPQTAANALQAGEIDIFEEVPPDMISAFKGKGGIKLEPQDTFGIQMVFRMNQLRPPFNNPKIRQAIRYMVDQEIFVRAHVDDPALYKVCPSYYMCSSPYFTDVGWVKQDLAKAKQLVKESGYDGTPVVVLHATEAGPTNTFSSVAEQLMREIGLKVEPQAMDWGTLTSRRTKKDPPTAGGWSLFISGPTGADMSDPVAHLALRSNCDKAWFGWPCDEQIEAMRAEWANITDFEARKQLAAKIQGRANETVPYVPLGTLYLVRAYSAKLSGLPKAAVPVYWNVSKAN